VNPPAAPILLRIGERRSFWQRLAGAMLVLVSTITSTASATPIVTGIHRTGEGVVPVVSSRASLAPSAPSDPIDPYWRVVALPSVPPITPYEAAVFSGRRGGIHVPSTWCNGADGIAGAGWIGLSLTTTNSLFPPARGLHSDYTTIYATTFTATEAGTVPFDLTATADNELSFFVNGEITGWETLLPSIVGGMQIGTTQRNLNRLHRFQGTAFVNAGENTLYAVVRDRYLLDPKTNIGGYGQTGLFVAAVPEPGSLASVLAAAACLLIGARWRCVRRPRRRRAEMRQRGSADSVAVAAGVVSCVGV
jgi:uncharacterized membrane protein